MFRYHTDPSGTFWECDAKAIGSGSEGADTSLQEHFNKVRECCGVSQRGDDDKVELMTEIWVHWDLIMSTLCCRT